MITALGFTTRGRPELLARCVRSYVDNARMYGRRPRVIIMDDHVPGEQPSARAVAEQIGREYPDFAVWYAGCDEKRRFAARVVAAGLPADVLEYALFDPERAGYTLGANRNALQLETLGEQAMYIDDDSLAALSRPPVWDDSLVLVGPGTTQEYWFFDDHAAALSATRPGSACLLSLHEAYLGRSCREIMEAAGMSAEADDAYWARYMRRQSVVRVTQNGVVGDSCMYSNIGHLLHGKDGTRARLSGSADDLDRAMSSREIIRAPTHPTLRMGGLLIGPNYACDQSTLLPPYMPVYRSSDSTFSSALSAVFPTHAFADVPWLVEHAPEPGRGYHGRGYSEPWHASIGEVVRGLLFVSSASAYHSFTDPLGEKGRTLVGYGALPLAEFTRIVTQLIDEMVQIKIDRLDRLRGLAGAAHPRYVQALARSAGLLTDSLKDPLHAVPVEVRRGRTPAEALAHTQRLVARFGELMQLWPTLDAQVRREERRLAVRV
ncbi:hypothetical protein [Sorangium sp. So ce204]|uniref:hypothetical protein n=1 Tax=Sorangium sp. So ce204 TaxID=3133288 RepID=UPI003F60356E